MSTKEISIINIFTALILIALPVSSAFAADAQTSQSDPEATRETLRSILESQLDTAVMMGETDLQETIARTLEQLDQQTWEDLAVFEGMEGQISELQAQQDALNDQIEILEESVPNLGEAMELSSQYSSAFLAGEMTGELTGADYIGLTNAGYGAICSNNPFGDPINTPNRANPDANQGLVLGLTASTIVLTVAEGVRDIANVACNTVLVIAGFGGNPQSLACLATEGIYIAAKAIDDGLNIAFRLLTFCDATIDGAEIEGAFERLADIYDQNIAHDANIDADLIAHDANIDADLIAHDANIDADLVTHDTDIKALLDTIQAGVDETIELLKTPTGTREGFPLR